MFAVVAILSFVSAFLLFKFTNSGGNAPTTNKINIPVSFPPIIPSIIPVPKPAPIPTPTPSNPTQPSISQTTTASTWNVCKTGMYEDANTINGFCSNNQFLSNYFPSLVTRRGLTYQSVEAAYQASKYDANPEIQKLFTKLNPDEAKTLSKSIPFDRDAFSAVDKTIMLELLKSKFSDATLKEKLKSTGTKKLIEFNTWDDTYWGIAVIDGALIGKNYLGELLMSVRSM